MSKTNPTLYDSIIAFDVDRPLSDYTFSDRLAKENYWTKDFTKKAIAEYKKFMYMAAISEFMVSPSKVVDAVWHQHLTFTQSYSDLCSVLGKQVQHVPSTKSKVDAERFTLARKRTIELYMKEFGTLPKDVWEFETMYDSLKLPKAKYKIRTVILVGLAIALVLLGPVFFILLPIYSELSSGSFFAMYLPIVVIAFILLRLYNTARFNSIFKSFDKSSFVFSLDASELIYLKKQTSDFVVHMRINKMVAEKKVEVDKDGKISASSDVQPTSSDEHAVLSRLGKEPVAYAGLVRSLESLPTFGNALNSMYAFTKYFTKSKAFGQMFYVNFGVILLVLLPGAARLLTGLSRGRPTGGLVFVLIVIAIIAIVFLLAMSTRLTRSIVPAYYDSRKPTKNASSVAYSDSSDADWNYFYYGVTMAAFTPAYSTYRAPSAGSSSDSDSSSSDSSCGSDGGSSCGGCGGGGGD